MADSADKLLARVRAASRCTWASNGLDDRRAVEAFAELDLLLSAGGPLPTDWAVCEPAPKVTDVPLADGASIEVIADDRMPPGTAAMTGADGQIHVITGIGEDGVLHG